MKPARMWAVQHESGHGTHVDKCADGWSVPRLREGGIRGPFEVMVIPIPNGVIGSVIRKWFAYGQRLEAGRISKQPALVGDRLWSELTTLWDGRGHTVGSRLRLRVPVSTPPPLSGMVSRK